MFQLTCNYHKTVVPPLYVMASVVCGISSNLVGRYPGRQTFWHQRRHMQTPIGYSPRHWTLFLNSSWLNTTGQAGSRKDIQSHRIPLTHLCWGVLTLKRLYLHSRLIVQKYEGRPVCVRWAFGAKIVCPALPAWLPTFQFNSCQFDGSACLRLREKWKETSS